MTKIRFERNAMMSLAHLTAEDGGKSFIFCAVPGGKPTFTFDLASKNAFPVADGPTCETHKEFEAFVRERFGD